MKTETIKLAGIDTAFVWTKPGLFLMGSPESEPERDDDELQHEVVLTEGFWLAEAACTQELWQAVMGSNPSHFQEPNRPVERVSWNDVQAFISELNAITEGTYRLPTEAEWEYACRAGTTTPFTFGKNITPEQSNYNGNYPYAGGKRGEYRRETVEVKSLPPNPWGLYEMHGNVWEWCADWYAAYESGTAIDPVGPSKGVSRVLRGGSFNLNAVVVRAACRNCFHPVYRSVSIGFRLARG